MFHECMRPGSLPDSDFDSTLSQEELRNLLIAFVHYLHVEHALSPSAIKTTMAGLRHAFRSRLFNITAFEDKMVLAARTAVSKAARPSAAPRGKKAPITLEMLRQLPQRLPSQRMVRIGMLLGFFNLMRASEIARSWKSSHTIRAKDVEFEIGDFTATPQMVPAHALGVLPWSSVRAVRITLRTTKTMREGQTIPSWFSTLTAAQRSQGQLCLVRELWDWVQEAHYQSPHDIFMSYTPGRGTRHELTYETLRVAVQGLASALGFDPSRYGTHSLRIGGATALHAAGASATTLMQAGQWRTLPVACQYPQRTSHAFDRQLQLLQQPTTVSTRDIHMSLPPRPSGSPQPVPPRGSSGHRTFPSKPQW
jgi:hypothetical protein